MTVAAVTGASAGLGSAFARRLARDGHDLVLIARREDRLRELAAAIESEHGRSVEVLVADLARTEPLRGVEDRLAREPNLEILVNNAGFGGYRPFVELDPDQAEELIRLQVVAVTRLTRAVLPGMVRWGRGAVVNVSSRLAYSGALAGPNLPARAIYAATKAFLVTFSQIVASELVGTGVRVQALCPGLVRTEFHQRMGIDPARFPAAAVMAADDVVASSLTGLRLGEVVCIPALDDPALLAAIMSAEREMFEQSRSGVPAARYRG